MRVMRNAALRLLAAALAAVGLSGAVPAHAAAPAAPVASVSLSGSVVNSDDLSQNVAEVLSFTYSDVLSDLCDLVPRLNDYGFAYDENVYCPSDSDPVWVPDLSVSGLCQAVVAPPGLIPVDASASKTSVWTLDASGTARGCVFPVLDDIDIKSLAARYRTALITYRSQSVSDLGRAVDGCDMLDGDRPCQVYDPVTRSWIPDPKKFAPLPLPPAVPRVTATSVTVPGVVAMAAGGGFQVFAKADGTVISRCDTTVPNENAGQCFAPSAAKGSLRLAAAGQHAVALRADGTVAEWGSVSVNGTSGAARVPAGLSGVVDIAAGQDFALALKSDGTVAAWGDNSQGQTAVPASAVNVVAVSAGRCHAVALRADGSVVSWGCAGAGQLPPAGAKAAAVRAAADRTMLWGATGGVTTYGMASGSSAPPTAYVAGYAHATGPYFAAGGDCLADKGEDVIRDDLGAASTKAEAPLNLSSDKTPAKSDVWAYSWTAPVRNGGKAVTGYMARFDHEMGRHWSAWMPVTSPFEVPKAPTGNLTRFEVRAVTAAGLGAVAHIATNEVMYCGDDQNSDVAVALTSAAPLAPTAPVVSLAALSPTQVRVAWSAASSSATSTASTTQVRYSADGKTWSTAPAFGYRAVLGNLKSGTTYQVQVVVTNSAGSTASATASAMTFADVAISALAVSGVAGRSANLSWKAPTTAAAKSIKDYRVEFSTDGFTWVASAHKASTKTMYTVTGLMAVTAYLFRVTPVTASGDGIPSTAVTATTTTDVPGQVSAIALASATAQSAVISWAAPADDGGLPVTAYTATVSPAVGKATVSGSSVTLTGFKLGTSYAITVAAVNAKGSGAALTTKVLVATVPAAPTVTVARTPTSVTLTWKAPAVTGGSKILRYVTSVTPATLAYTVSGTKAVFANLPAGTRLTFSVAAASAFGVGTAAVIATGTATAPAAPTLSYATKDAKTLLVSWLAPADTGGGKITGYKTRTSTDGGKTFTAWVAASGTSTTVARPAPGGSVTVEVAAVSMYGTGAAGQLVVTG